MPLFIDTLNDLKTTNRFSESYGSYPVLRVQDPTGSEIGGRIDGNPVQGNIAVEEILAQFKTARKKWAESTPEN